VSREKVRGLGVAFLGAVVLAAVAASSPVAADISAPVHTGFLKTPSRSVYCDYRYGGAGKAYRYVRCGFRGSLVPPEPKPRGGCRVVDYVGNRVVLHQTGRGRTEPCAGDAGPFADPQAARTVPLGTTWHGGPFSCSSSQAGMTCRNSAGHGFFLAHRNWRLF
jgi:hypothetical protein